jgi:hypothetical protein
MLPHWKPEIISTHFACHHSEEESAVFSCFALLWHCNGQCDVMVCCLRHTARRLSMLLCGWVPRVSRRRLSRGLVGGGCQVVQPPSRQLWVQLGKGVR